MSEVSRNRYIMDRNLYDTNTLPKGYNCTDVTDWFELSSEGLKLNPKDKQGLANTGLEGFRASVGTLRALLIKIELGEYAIYTIIAIDRIYKELFYIQLQNIK